MSSHRLQLVASGTLSHRGLAKYTSSQWYSGQGPSPHAPHPRCIGEVPHGDLACISLDCCIGLQSGIFSIKPSSFLEPATFDENDARQDMVIRQLAREKAEKSYGKRTRQALKGYAGGSSGTRHVWFLIRTIACIHHAFMSICPARPVQMSVPREAHLGIHIDLSTHLRGRPRASRGPSIWVCLGSPYQWRQIIQSTVPHINPRSTIGISRVLPPAPPDYFPDSHPMSQHTFDIIVAGGGTSGLVLAGRLAAADSSLSILVVEAGPQTRDDPLHLQPARYPYHLRSDSTTVKFNVGRESTALGGRAPVVPCGQCLGGGSSINFSMYTRAAASDYDDWAAVHGNPGWSSKDLLPLLRKCETYEIAPGKPTHGYSGPLKVSYGGTFLEAAKEFLDVAAQYDTARGSTDDVNGLFEANKYGRWQKWIDSKAGVRSDIPHHYIYHRDLKNLHILTGYHVKRVIVEGGRATGVEYIPNKRFHPDARLEVTSATARRLVIISAGTFGSPAILERSGIGAKNVLKKVGVKEIINLPGVGENYQDHQTVFPPYAVAEGTDTLDGIATSDEAELQKWGAQWEKRRDGLMAHNGLDAGGKLRPFKTDLDVIGEAFRKRWLEYYVPAPDKPVIWFGLVALYLGDRSQVPVNKSYAVGWYIQHPTSIGRLHITSHDDLEAPLDFHPGYLDSPEDMAVHKWAYKMSREFARRMPSYRGEVAGGHPAFSQKSQAAPRLHNGPVPILAPNFEYTEEDEKAIEDYIRQAVRTAWHSLGTCAMKSREKGGVVNSRLNVYGLDGLKVADMSICPSNVAANTYSTAIVIGEKAAVIIAEELGIPIDDGSTSESSGAFPRAKL